MGPEIDWNVQCDTSAALAVAEAADLTLVTLPVTLHAHLTAAELPRLAASGSLGDLFARQAKAHGEDHNMAPLLNSRQHQQRQSRASCALTPKRRGTAKPITASRKHQVVVRLTTGGGGGYTGRS